MEIDLKKVTDNIEKLNQGFSAFKEEMKSRTPDPAKIAKIESDISTRDAANQAFIVKTEAEQKAHKAALDELEKKLNRGQLGLGGGEREQKAQERKDAYEAFLRFGVPGKDIDAEEKWARHAEQKGIKLERKAMTLSDDTSGGYLSEADFMKEIIKASVLISPMRNLVRVRFTSNRDVKVPKRTGTAAARWTGETQVRTETQNPTYGLVDCHVHEMTAEVYVSFQDLEDSAFDLQAELSQEFAEQFALTEGQSIVVGNGSNKPFGFTDAGQSVPQTASGTSASIASATGAKGDALINLCHSVKEAYAVNGRWGLARKTLGSVRKLTDTQGRYLWEPAIAAGMPSMILGYPYTEIPDMPLEAANSLSVAFGDFKRAYILVDRLQLAVVRDPYTQASNGNVKFLARRRMGGQVTLAEAIGLLKCG